MERKADKEAMNKSHERVVEEGDGERAEAEEEILIAVRLDRSMEGLIMAAETQKGGTSGCGETFEVGYDDICGGLEALSYRLESIQISLRYAPGERYPSSLFVPSSTTRRQKSY